MFTLYLMQFRKGSEVAKKYAEGNNSINIIEVPFNYTQEDLAKIPVVVEGTPTLIDEYTGDGYIGVKCIKKLKELENFGHSYKPAKK